MYNSILSLMLSPEIFCVYASLVLWKMETKDGGMKAFVAFAILCAMLGSLYVRY